jgi:acyl-CoA thioesterase
MCNEVLKRCRSRKQDFMLSPQNALHGGVIALVMDVSMGHLLARSPAVGVTLELKTQFLRSVKGEPAKVIGSIVKSGRRIQFLEARLNDSSNKLAPVSTSTWKTVAKDRENRQKECQHGKLTDVFD